MMLRLNSDDKGINVPVHMTLLELNPHLLHALPDLFNWDIENTGNVLWRGRVDVSRLSFHAYDVLDVLF